MINKIAIDPVLVRDFGKLQLLTSLQRLNMEIHTTSMSGTCSQWSENPSDCLASVCNTIYVVTLSNEELAKAFAISRAFPGLSHPEYTVLYLAHHHGLELVTGDSRMYKVAGEMNITVHNYLWLFCELVKAGTLTLNMAVVKYYELAKSVNRHAIWEEPALALSEALAERRRTA